jgi:hypothetical protein
MLSTILTEGHGSGRLRPGWLAGLVLLSLTGAIGLLILTRWGIGTSPDSVQYIRAARVLMGEADAGGETGASLLTHRAPLYPMLLAVLGRLGVDPLAGARWLNALLFGFNIFVVGLLVQRNSRHARWLWLVAAVMMVGSLPALSIHVAALTEPLFLLLTLAGFAALARHLDGAMGRGWLAGAGIAFGLAFLARYAGLAAILAAGAGTLLLGVRPVRRRLGDALLFSILAALPMFAWMLRNLLVASTATGRELFLHPIGTAHAWQALYTASGWLLIPASAPDPLRFAAWSLLGVAGVALVVRGRQGRTGTPMMVQALALFVPVYCLFLAASISFFDANTPLDNRILLPVFATGLILVLYGVDLGWPVLIRRPALASVAVIALTAFTAAHLVSGTEVAAAGYTHGWGFTSRSWQESPTLNGVRSLPSAVPIYSNAPEIVYLHTGRGARSLPRTRFLMNGGPNRQFSAELAELDADLAATCGVIVYFRTLPGQKSMPSESDLETRLSVRAIAETADGSILGAAACRP